MRLSTLLFGKATLEYWNYRRRERQLDKAGRDLEAEKRREDLKTSRWVAAEEDWPGHHSADVPDHDAAKLIWSREFTTAGSRLQDSYEKQPVAASEADTDVAPP